MADYFVYILSNKSRMLYIGVTNNLERRLFEHREKFVSGFPERFGLTKLVYYEVTGNIEAAITREKELKGWVRRKKVALIHSFNPEWNDLSVEWMPPNSPPCHSERAKRTNEYRGGGKYPSAPIPFPFVILRAKGSHAQGDNNKGQGDKKARATGEG